MIFFKLYFDNNLIIILKEGFNIDIISDLNDKNIGLELGLFVDLSVGKNENILIISKEVKKYSIFFDVILVFNVGLVDVVIVDEIYVCYVVLKDIINVYIISLEIIGIEQYGIGFRLGDEIFKIKIDEVFDVLFEEGLIEFIFIKYFGVNLFVR